MNLPPIICANCGRTYDLPEHLSHGPCVACGTINCRPQAEGESLDKLQRATRLRLEGNHGEALKCYEHVLVDFDDEHSALWGKLLCQYGVEFVTDPKTGVRHATVHVPQSRPMQLHADYRRACELAPEEVRTQYEADAAYVDEALAEINRHKDSSPPYDVFICHKTTHLTGPGYTEDYNRGVQLTMLLTGMGYRVFFAPLSGLTPGASYEAGIYYALWSAKVMLLISSDVAFLTSPWVKSEWTRYLEMLDDGADKHLIPLMYDRLADSRMPREIRLRGLQSIRMDSDLDAKAKLLAAMEKYTGKGTPAPVQPVVVQPVEAPTPQPAPAPKAEPVKPQPAPAPKAEPVKPQPAPAPKAEPVRLQPAPAPKAEPVKPQPAPAPKAEPVKPQPAPAPKAEHVKPQPAPAPKAEPVRPQPAPAPKAEPVKPQPAPAPKAEPARPMQVSPAKAPALHFDAVPVTGGVSVTKYTGKAAKVEIPAVIGGKPVVEIGEEAFEACIQMQEVVIPEGVRKLGNYAFKDCSGLQMVRLPDSLENMGYSVFWNCSRLEELSIPAKVTAGARTVNWFLGCKKLKKITTAPGAKLQVRDGVLFNQSGCLVAYPMALPARSYTVPAGTKEIACRAFEGSSLEEIILPSGVTVVNHSAFMRCAALKRLELPDSLRSIDDWAFDYCGLPELTIPGKTAVADKTFDLFRGLLRVYRDSPAHKLAVRKELRHEVIGETAAKSATMPATKPDVTVPALHFDAAPVTGGVSVTKYTGPGGAVVIPATIGEKKVVEIGEDAFKECRTLKKVEIPQGVIRIQDNAFWNCTELTDVRIPDSVICMGNCVFLGCSKLTDVHIPAGVEKIGFGPFAKCPALRKITVAEGNRSFYSRDDVLLSRQGVLVSYPCGREAAEYAIPDGVTRIGDWSFYGAGKLQRVSIPQSVKTLGSNAFEHCSSLVSVRIPDGVPQIPGALFDGCSSLREVHIPETVTSIGSFAFDGCHKLTSLTIPASVRTIEKYAIARCSNLTLRVHANSAAHRYAKETNLRFELISSASRVAPAVKAPEASDGPRVRIPVLIGSPESHFKTSFVSSGLAITGYFGPGGEVEIPMTIGGWTVREIGEDAFKDCQKITKMTIPMCVQNIGEHAFQGCSGLTYLSIPKGVKKIGSLAFQNCTRLEEVYISESVEWIGANPFAGCTALKTMRVADKNLHYCARGNILLMRTDASTLVCCAAGVKTAGQFDVPEEVRRIGPYAFQGCDMARIDINPGVTEISNYAFWKCDQLTRVSIPASVRKIGDAAFEDSPRLRLIVPKGSYAHDYARVNGLDYEAVGLISRLFGKK